jgi:hypothetical protein
MGEQVSGCDQGFGSALEKLGALHDPLLGLATAARVCRYRLDLAEPDLGELRQLIGEMVEVAVRSVEILRR